MPNLPLHLRETADAVARIGAEFASLSDDALLGGQRLIAEHRRAIDQFSAGIAGEIARRSHRDLGVAGLAQRAGFLNAESLIQSVTKSTRAEAAKFVQVGALDPQSPVASAVVDGTLSVDAAQSITRGLGSPDRAITPSVLAHASTALLDDASRLDADALYRRARDLRDELDANSVARREKEQNDQRYFRGAKQRDGMYRGSFLVGAEDGALVTAAFEAVLSPRRGGPRFVDPQQVAADEALVLDKRTDEQIAADAFVSMIQLAVDADPGTLFGKRRPAVRVLVTATSLTTGIGAGRIEDSGEPVSIETVRRLLCDTGVIGIEFDDDGQSLNVGRTKRLFTERQRIALAARDGGCMFGDCDRPPSWCEAHHIDHWHEDGGKTDVADGILMCKRHHLQLHNGGWKIFRQGAQYWLVPPKTTDPSQAPIPLRSHTAEFRAKRAS